LDTDPSLIDISDLPKHMILAALYNGAEIMPSDSWLDATEVPQGGMTVEEAKWLLGCYRTPSNVPDGSAERESCLVFDRLCGRALHLDLSGDSLDPAMYEAINGCRGWTAGIIEALRTGSFLPYNDLAMAPRSGGPDWR
jgi:hypothetical protein